MDRLRIIPAVLVLASLLTPVGAQTVVVMPQTYEAALGQPRVSVRLDRAGQVIKGKSELAGLGLDDLLGPGQMRDDVFDAYLDTGASAIVLSAETAARFGIIAEDGAVYHETGLHGETPMHVSEPLGVAIGSGTSRFEAVPGAGVRLQINPKPAEGIMAMMGEINVVGMPAIAHFVVEIDPMAEQDNASQQLLKELGEDLKLDVDLTALAQLDKMLGSGTRAVLHPPTFVVPRDQYDHAIPLKLVDFSRHKYAKDAGPKPALGANPMIHVETATPDGAFAGNWLLDTGAAASIISTAHAIALGLLDADGNPAKPQAFTLPIGGIEGEVSMPPGFVIAVLRLRADDGTVLEYHDVRVLVHDVGTTLDDGTEVVLDGVFGMNLLLPGATGLSTGFPTDFGEPPVRRFWIDTHRGRLILKLAE